LLLPERLQRLLWVVSVNGALLALEGTLQRTFATNKLLWLVEPFYDKAPDSQFGPYAYRSNAAQYLGMVWPLTLGFWCLLRLGASRELRPRSTANLLLPCAMLTAIAPLISLSRAGLVISCGAVVIAAIILLNARRQAGWKWKLGLACFLAAVLALGWVVGWTGLAGRFKDTEGDFASGRGPAWQATLRMARDCPVFGTGPGTFGSVYQLYRRSPGEEWFAYAHNDWLETAATFGWVGFSTVLFMLILAVSGWFLRCGSIPAHRVLVKFLWLSLAGCLVYAVVDFPFQIYSVLSFFLLVCSILSCLSRRG
jgi:O-antigen ligase